MNLHRSVGSRWKQTLRIFHPCLWVNRDVVLEWPFVSFRLRPASSFLHLQRYFVLPFAETFSANRPFSSTNLPVVTFCFACGGVFGCMECASALFTGVLKHRPLAHCPLILCQQPCFLLGDGQMAVVQFQGIISLFQR